MQILLVCIRASLSIYNTHNFWSKWMIKMFIIVHCQDACSVWTRLIWNCWVYAANELCDRFASAGFHANMISYLTQQLNMGLVPASNTLTNFNGTSNFTPLIGALIADSFAGRFWTIVVASFIYELVSIPLHCFSLSTILVTHIHQPY